MSACHPAEILNIINGLQTKKASRIDKIPAQNIKISADIIAPYLCEVFNNCLIQGIFPEALKIAKVSPIHKAGNKEETNTYRPISVLPVFSKNFEKLIYTRLYKFLKKNNILCQNQYGFRGHSASLAITDICNILLENKLKKQYTCPVFLDLKKAFDTINHSILLHKLYQYGIRGCALHLFESYLNNRTQFTTTQNAISHPRTISTGVPQGSTLRPLLFRLYINEYPSKQHLHIACTLMIQYY